MSKTLIILYSITVFSLCQINTYANDTVSTSNDCALSNEKLLSLGHFSNVLAYPVNPQTDKPLTHIFLPSVENKSTEYALTFSLNNSSFFSAFPDRKGIIKHIIFSNYEYTGENIVCKSHGKNGLFEIGIDIDCENEPELTVLTQKVVIAEGTRFAKVALFSPFLSLTYASSSEGTLNFKIPIIHGDLNMLQMQINSTL